MIGRRCFVSGVVQGVWYRAATRAEALRLGLSGYARNLPDGRVEVVVCGDAPVVESLCAWLWQGPPAARVSDVAIEPIDPADIDRGTFSVR